MDCGRHGVEQSPPLEVTTLSQSELPLPFLRTEKVTGESTFGRARFREASRYVDKTCPDC